MVEAPGAVGHGLTEQEAAARLRAGSDNDANIRPVRTWDMARRESVFTIFQLNILGLVIIQIMLREWVGALITLGMMGLTTALRVAQERAAHRRIQEVSRRTRPMSTVVRDGNRRSVPSRDLVPGDLVLVGPGDQLYVDGRIVGDGAVLVDSAVVTGRRSVHRAAAGDEVFAGASCVSGRAHLMVERVGSDRLIHARMLERTALAAHPTPLERLVGRILTGLLVIVACYAAVLVAKFLHLDVGDSLDALVDAAPVIFGLAPTGLYLMIIVTYATGTAHLARAGAVVHSARTVEALAATSVLCVTDVGLLTGTALELSPLGPDGEDRPSPSQLRQLVGDFARSTSEPTPLSRVLQRSFEGEVRPVRWEASHAATHGWVAVVFDDPDDPFIHVLGDARVLAPSLVGADESMEQREGPTDPPGVAVEMIMLARAPAGSALVDDSGEPVLPAGLELLCVLRHRRHLNPEAVQVVRDFVAAGVRIKVFSVDPVDRVLAALRAAGLSSQDEARLLSGAAMSHAEFTALPRSEWAVVLNQTKLFGGLAPDDVAGIVQELREQGSHVTVVGDGVADLPALRAAGLAVVPATGTQAALGLADIVLMERSPSALLQVLHRGQVIVRGLLDVIKLNLSVVLCAALLILDVRLLGSGFPYVSAQGTVLSVLVVTIPSLLLPLWVPHGAVPSSGHLRTIVRFCVPAGGTLSLAAFGVYVLVLARTGEVASAQLAVTWTLLYAGLVLGVLTRPRAPEGKRDLRPAVLAAVLAVVGTGMPLVPIARRQFRLDLLPGVVDYGIVVGAVVVWFVALHLVWRILPRSDV